MEDIALSVSKSDGELSETEETTQNECPSELPRDESEGSRKEGFKENEETRSLKKRHKSTRPSEHPCSRGAFHDLFCSLRKQGRLSDLPRYYFECILSIEFYMLCFFFKHGEFVFNMYVTWNDFLYMFFLHVFFLNTFCTMLSYF